MIFNLLLTLLCWPSDLVLVQYHLFFYIAYCLKDDKIYYFFIVVLLFFLLWPMPEFALSCCIFLCFVLCQ